MPPSKKRSLSKYQGKDPSNQPDQSKPKKLKKSKPPVNPDLPSDQYSSEVEDNGQVKFVDDTNSGLIIDPKILNQLPVSIQ